MKIIPCIVSLVTIFACVDVQNLVGTEPEKRLSETTDEDWKSPIQLAYDFDFPQTPAMVLGEYDAESDTAIALTDNPELKQPSKEEEVGQPQETKAKETAKFIKSLLE